MQTTGRRRAKRAPERLMKATLPMAKRDPHRAELDELAADLARPAAGRRGDADVAAASGHKPDLDRALEIEPLLRELQSKLTDAADDAEAILTAHPLVAVASAFLLGIVIGCMMGRR
jgi:ElaB/YqjD/DUF883 family membrane-anchored ribosome-binding protein